MEYNKANLNLLSEQLDLNTSLITKLERLEAESDSRHNEVISLNRTINELHSTVKMLSHELAATTRQLSNAERERDEVASQLEADRSNHSSTSVDMNHSTVENTALREQLVRQAEEIHALQSDLHDSHRAMRQQQTETDEIISVLEPELVVFKHLNQGLHGEISRLGKDLDVAQGEKHALREHIGDLTGALDGFAVKYNAEADQRQTAIRQLHERSVLRAALEAEHERSLLRVQELEAEVQQMGLLDASGDREYMQSEIERLSDEVEGLNSECGYLREEAHGLQCDLAQQLVLRAQERDSYKFLLLASDDNKNQAVETSKRNLEAVSDGLVREAQRVAVEANQARRDTAERCTETQCQVEILSSELQSLRGEYDRVCLSSSAAEKGAREELSSYTLLQEATEKDRQRDREALTSAIEEARSSSKARLKEKRDNAEQYISQLSAFQSCVKDMREEAWAMRVKIGQLDTQLSLVRYTSARCKRTLLDSLTALQEEHLTVFRHVKSSHSALTIAHREEANRSMYLNSEVTNLKLELYDSRRKR